MFGLATISIASAKTSTPPGVIAVLFLWARIRIMNSPSPASP